MVIIKRAHGALTDSATVVVPGALDGDLAPAIRQLTSERERERERIKGIVEEMLKDSDSECECEGACWSECASEILRRISEGG